MRRYRILLFVSNGHMHDFTDGVCSDRRMAYRR